MKMALQENEGTMDDKEKLYLMASDMVSEMNQGYSPVISLLIFYLPLWLNYSITPMEIML
jgi:hypothetical protein